MQPTKIKTIVQHTAGPWQRHYSSSTPGEWVIGGEGFAPVIAFVTRDEEDDMLGATVEANARLITAAPELLAIVKEHLADHLEACHITRRGDVCVLARQTQEIIAKAEGRES